MASDYAIIVAIRRERALPILRWSRLAASAKKALYSVNCFLSGKEIPYTRCSESLLASPRKYDAEFCVCADYWMKSVRRREGRTFVTMNALMRPVWGMWGPTHKSTMGPQR